MEPKHRFGERSLEHHSFDTEFPIICIKNFFQKKYMAQIMRHIVLYTHAKYWEDT